MSKEDRDASHIFGTLKGHRRFFSPEDDQTLQRLKGESSSVTWAQIADRMPGFNARQLRERWCNYLSPELKTNGWTEEEDCELMRLYTELGPRWGIIGGRMGNRSAPDIKNRFQSIRNRNEKSLRRAKREMQPDRPQPRKIVNTRVFAPLARRRGIGSLQERRQNHVAPPQSPSDFSIKSILVYGELSAVATRRPSSGTRSGSARPRRSRGAENRRARAVLRHPDFCESPIAEAIRGERIRNRKDCHLHPPENKCR
jgi:hypothetical protein